MADDQDRLDERPEQDDRQDRHGSPIEREPGSHPGRGSNDRPTVLVTGATSGIGRVLAERLALRGWTVLLHGRSRARAERVARAIGRRERSARVEPVAADLADLGEIRGLIARTGARPRLDALVNNAGVATPNAAGGARQVTRDGMLAEWQVNFLAPFMLTLGLSRLLADSADSAPGRVVNVSSSSQGFGTIVWADTQLERGFDRMTAYAQSKVALTMFTAEYAARMPSGLVTANAVHPGTCYTKMIRSTLLFAPHTARYGAANVERVLLAERYRAVSGAFVHERRESSPNALVRDERSRSRLWNLAAAQTGIGPDWTAPDGTSAFQADPAWHRSGPRAPGGRRTRAVGEG